jgi:dCMP deaminase
MSQKTSNPPRLTWDEYYVSMLQVVRKRATCLRAQHSALVVKDNRLISEGYNGSVAGKSHCIDVGCLIIGDHCKRTIHAEANAYLQAAKNGISLDGATLYVTGMPCIDCAKDSVSVGIKTLKIADIEQYSNFQPQEILFWNEIMKDVDVEWLVYSPQQISNTS